MRTELQLIEAAQAGSADAFADLVRRYRDGLLRFLLTRCGSYADAEDALQDTLINAFRYIKSYDPRWRFSTWLYRIAIRNAARMRTPDVLELGDVRDEENDPLLQCIADSESENLWLSARHVLNDEVFAAMWLRYAEDMSVNDISKTLDRSASWTKVNLMRGRRALDVEMNGTKEKNEAYG
ncbi:MAG: sigma-70 family RNA polymerase sigma factor [Gammaproteobacteria bacterium]|nr:sigma-70 family RNA polymerase sigma factor [Gammaproteobacteria bacterium]